MNSWARDLSVAVPVDLVLCVCGCVLYHEPVGMEIVSNIVIPINLVFCVCVLVCVFKRRGGSDIQFPMIHLPNF